MGPRVVLTNVRVFDGRQLRPPGPPGSLHASFPVIGRHGAISGADQATLDALRAATTRPARYFGVADRGVADRGVAEPGRRADLVLIDGDPLHDIKATQAIRRVWWAGTEVTPV